MNNNNNNDAGADIPTGAPKSKGAVAGAEMTYERMAARTGPVTPEKSFSAGVLLGTVHAVSHLDSTHCPELTIPTECSFEWQQRDGYRRSPRSSQ
jgi:hypothetical protein